MNIKKIKQGKIIYIYILHTEGNKTWHPLNYVFLVNVYTPPCIYIYISLKKRKLIFFKKMLTCFYFWNMQSHIFPLSFFSLGFSCPQWGEQTRRRGNGEQKGGRGFWGGNGAQDPETRAGVPGAPAGRLRPPDQGPAEGAEAGEEARLRLAHGPPALLNKDTQERKFSPPSMSFWGGCFWCVIVAMVTPEWISWEEKQTAASFPLSLLPETSHTCINARAP